MFTNIFSFLICSDKKKYEYVYNCPQKTISNQSSDSTSGSIVSECRLGKSPQRGLKTVSFNP